MNLSDYSIAMVIPAYKVEKEINLVLSGVPEFIRHIIVVDDASPDSTAKLVAESAHRDGRILLIRHPQNQGVGGAMLTGFRKAVELNADMIIKLDGDNQMDPAHISALLLPLAKGKADYTKGNRFRDFDALQRMPLIRRLGNLGLSFLTKAATGYWNIFDPTNGYFAIRTVIIKQLPLEQIDRRYFFETSMLANLYLINAYIVDIPIPARYGNEKSNLSIRRTLFEFPFKLAGTFLRRLLLRYFIYDFSMMSIYLLSGIPLLFFGLIFGGIKWIQYASQNIPAPTGTVMLPTLCVLLGIQILLSAFEIDMNATPKSPITEPLD